ncbi:RadC family protein [Streptococcus massiliensis]|uniref:DNA repair protein RadC n=1 Tax=Streptococcus massiliensis TaxID=313439 RepID=A0A380KVP2_9STRE|nr:DNA repair protein RadC [Streptococcus massiliensis]SUN76003.1 DNA repair protein RadC [Streptococcus massiliensis]
MYQISIPVHSLKPRERLVADGASTLSNQELLAILLRTGTKKETVFQVSQRILSNLGNLADLRKLSLQELQTISGIGPVKAIELQAMVELGRRICQAELPDRDQILSSKKLATKMMQELGDKQQEHLVALYLNTQNQIIHQQTIFIGSINRSIAEPREILHYAVKHLANSIIIVHNHPSGSTKPSRNDDDVTQRVKKACETLGILLLDHLIVSEQGYYSYREETELL